MSDEEERTLTNRVHEAEAETERLRARITELEAERDRDLPLSEDCLAMEERAERAEAALADLRSKVREFAEMWLYDGDTDNPIGEIYYALLALAPYPTAAVSDA